MSERDERRVGDPDVSAVGHEPIPALESRDAPTAFAAEAPACLECGACCFSQLEAFVRVSGDDYSRLAAQAEELVSFDGVTAHMRMQDGHCSALAIATETGTFVCTAYDVRPQICRDLGRGSGECGAERLAKAGRPLLALGRALRALP